MVTLDVMEIAHVIDDAVDNFEAHLAILLSLAPQLGRGRRSLVFHVSGGVGSFMTPILMHGVCLT